MIDYLPSTDKIRLLLCRLYFSKYKKIWKYNPVKSQEDYAGSFSELMTENNNDNQFEKRYLWKLFKKLEIIGILMYSHRTNRKYYYIDKKIILETIKNDKIYELMFKMVEDNYFVIKR